MRTGQSLNQSGHEDRAKLVDRILEIADRIAATPVLDPRPPEQILGYDEHGVPR